MAYPPQNPDADENLFDDVENAVGRLKDAFLGGLSKNGEKPSGPGAPSLSSFFAAVKSKNTAAVLKALEAGIDPNAYNSGGQTAMHIAAINNATDVAILLIEHNANPCLGMKNTPERTPLEDAVSFNKPEMAALLARHGGYAPGIMKDGWSLLLRACDKGKARIVRILLEAGADGNEMTENGTTPLLIAARLGNAELTETLLEFPAVTERMNDLFVKTDEKCLNAFLRAVDRGNAPTVKALIEKGANVNSTDAEGATALLYAIRNGNIPLVQMLVDAGSDIRGIDNPYRIAPLVYASYTETLNAKNRAKIIDILIQAGADPDALDPANRISPLHLLIKRSMTEGTEALSAFLSYPVNKELHNSQGETPLMSALNGSGAGLQTLLKAGANPNARHGVDAGTPLMQAVRRSDMDGVISLLYAGANPALYDAFGKSAISYARETDQKEMILTLERALVFFQQTEKNKALKNNKFAP